jgi:hypothetical protein
VASGAASFDFAADPAFAWDRMYVFGCYSSRASVEKALGFSWPDFSKTTIEYSDSVVLVVFVHHGKVVGWYEQPRSIELGYLANDKGYTRSEAVFDVDRSTGSIELKPLTPAPAPAGTAAGLPRTRGEEWGPRGKGEEWGQRARNGDILLFQHKVACPHSVFIIGLIPFPRAAADRPHVMWLENARHDG